MDFSWNLTVESFIIIGKAYWDGGIYKMLHREDMLELTRRMNLSRTSFTRIAGCYCDREGNVEGTFNTNFLKLSPQDKKKHLELAKAVLFSKTNEQLKEYTFSAGNQGPESMRQLLEAMRQCGLKNDALMDIFYEQISEKYSAFSEYGIFVFHDRYDVPAKGTDKERQWESEEVFEYLICVICPVDKEYEPGKPLCGFLYPSFKDRSCDLDHIAVFRERETKNFSDF